MLTDPTILVDDREKTPLIFPAHLTVHNPTVPWAPSSRIIRLHTAPSRLETGDYVLASHPRRGCVERKAHLSELAGNLFDERRYGLFTAELERLRDQFSHPLLLLEGSPTRPFRVRPGLPPADVVMDALFACLSRYTVPVLFLDASTVDARRNAASIVARHLLHAATGEGPCRSKCLPVTTPPPASP